jgi:hypothetical protein
MKNVNDLHSIATAKNRVLSEIDKQLADILEEAEIKANQGYFEMGVDKWCGDYTPHAKPIVDRLRKLGFELYTGAHYSYYISWRRTVDLSND